MKKSEYRLKKLGRLLGALILLTMFILIFIGGFVLIFNI